MAPTTHYIIGTAAAFSHCQPLIRLSLALLASSPSLCISVILHKNNEENSTLLVDAANKDVQERIKLVPVGNKTAWNDTVASYMEMVYKSGEAYGMILATHAPWPFPTAFIYDFVAFTYPHIKSAVESNFPGITSPPLVGYMPESTSEILYHAGAVENGSLMWVRDELLKRDPEAYTADVNSIMAAANAGQDAQTIVMPAEERKERLVKLYRELLSESDQVINIPGNDPFHLYERWATNADWTAPVDFGWVHFLTGVQDASKLPVAWITNFPSSVLEPEALKAANVDPLLTNKGEKPFLEMGFFAAEPKADWGEGVKSFLDKFGPKEVVYVSFGTIVDAGDGLNALFEVLEETKTPFLYACGGQKSSLPSHVVEILHTAESEGRAIAPDWVDQVGVLTHPAVVAFVSHCGANSTLEGIYAAKPIICWARKWDQVQLSAMVKRLGVGYELLQHRGGHCVGREILHAPGVIIEGTNAARKAEIKAALEAVKSEQGDVMVENAKAIAGEIRNKRKGEWDGNLKKFAEMFAPA